MDENLNDAAHQKARRNPNPPIPSTKAANPAPDPISPRTREEPPYSTLSHPTKVNPEVAADPWLKAKDSWPAFSEKAHARWPNLSAPDIAAVSGDRERMVSLVERSYGIPRPEAETQVDDWYRTL